MSLTGAFRLLDGQTVAGASASGDTPGAGDGPVHKLMFPHLAASVQAEINGNPTACVINVMALLDGATWDTIAVLDIAEGYVSGEIQPISFPAPFRQIKANLATLSGGTAPSVSCYFTVIG